MPANRALLEQALHDLMPDAQMVRHLGTGGFASTFQVTTIEGDVTAVKIIDPAIAEVERVDREFRAIASVDHPNVVRYRRVGVHTFGGVEYRWIEMDFVSGQSLAEALRNGASFDVRRAVALIRDFVAGASAIWEAGTAHRDLSPNNLLITDEGDGIIVDLGLARHVDDETITILPTPGTPGWMSPEQVGASPTHGDWRSDQFVLGLVAYVLLTGVPPYAAPNNVALWLAPAQQTPRPLRAVKPELPAVVADVVERMLSQKPHRRYLLPNALRLDLERAASALEVAAPATQDDPAFFLTVGQRKNYITTDFLQALRPNGVVIDAQARGRIRDLSECATAAGVPAAIDPVTHLSRSPLAVRPAAYRKLVHGEEPLLTGFSTEEQRIEWCREVLAAQLDYEPATVVSPYLYAAHAELSWVDESLACARVTQELVNDLPAGRPRPDVWTGVAISSNWLTNETERDDLLAAITGQPMSNLYLLVATNQPTFGPLADLETIEGLRDLIAVMREADVRVTVARRASSGLLLLALGASGWTYGVTGNLMNMQAHPETETDGGPGYDRVYVPQLLNHIATPTYALMQQQKPDLVGLDTEPGRQLSQVKPALDDLETEERVLLTQHNVLALRAQVTELAQRPAAQRITLLREWVASARTRYAALPPTRLPGEGPAFLQVWENAI